MKKYTLLTVILLILSVLVMSSCGQQAAEPVAEEPVPVVEVEEPAEEPEPVEEPEPEEVEEVITESAKAVALRDYAVIEKLDRDTEIEVLCDVTGLEDYSLVRVGDRIGLMGKQFFRMEGQEFTQWNARTTGNALFCTGYDMEEASARTLANHTALTVLAELDYCYVVQKEDGTIGCVANDEVYDPTKVSSSSSGESTPAAQEGEDIVIAAYVASNNVAISLGYEVTETEELQGKATVVVNQAPLLAGLYEYGDAVAVSDRGDENSVLECAGIQGQVEKRFLLFEGESGYESWTGYTDYNAGCFKNIRLIGIPEKKCSVNTEVTVLNEFKESYLVEWNGELYYMDLEDVFPKPITVTTGHGEEWTVPVK